MYGLMYSYMSLPTILSKRINTKMLIHINIIEIKEVLIRSPAICYLITSNLIFSHSIWRCYNSYQKDKFIMMLNYLNLQFNETFNNLCYDYIHTNNIHWKR